MFIAIVIKRYSFYLEDRTKLGGSRAYMQISLVLESS